MQKKKLALKKTKISKLNITILDKSKKANIKGGDVVQPDTHPTPVYGGDGGSAHGAWYHESYDAQTNSIHGPTCYYDCGS
ncbi:hypothetical protein [Chryseobacterium gleum]|uniref:hypothetical protein n=1 Tax=Chryseobacterium gleum TaxID=250 RepID=UPI001E3E89F1|nr:hypothetical protein [Chryseobacterium gleum]MCD9618741.1 hypothetical protein [Chryseobacterium gleum]MCE4065304.1 hypothetical protein [Chryseobacterium gleum]